MDRLNGFQRAGLGFVGFGIATFGAMHFMIDYAGENPEQFRASANECLSGLGKVALQTSSIPDGCKDYADGFDSSTTFTQVRKDGEVTETTRDTVYTLPTKAEFKEYVDKSYEISQDLKHKAPLIAAGLGGAIGALGLGTSELGRRRRET